MAGDRRELRKCSSCGKPTYKDDPVCMWCGEEAKPPKKEKKKESKFGNIAMWVISVFMAVASISYFPSVASVLMLLFVAISVPIGPIKEFWLSHGINGGKKAAILVLLFLVSSAITPSTKPDNALSDDSTKNVEDLSESSESEKNVEEKEPDTIEVVPVVDTSFDTTGYEGFDANVLFDYGIYMGGKNVLTVITVNSKDPNHLKANTDNNDGNFFSVVCRFDDGIPEGIEEGDVVTVVGTLEEHIEISGVFSFMESPTAAMEHCSVIGYGEIAQDLKNGSDSQREIGAQAKKSYEDAVAAQKKAERDEYIGECQTVNYKDVERNPDNYDGKKVKISGKVVQVSEGFLDSVTLRVSVGGNMWYVTYTRKEGESRILEDDSITCYGECNGVRSYTTVLGSQVTIPSMKMKYYS